MHLSKTFFALVLCTTTIISGHAFAFNMPSELTTLNNQSLTQKISAPTSENIKSKILAQYSRWKGTRYHFGGASHRGIDCSALMQAVFQGSMNMSLPRTTGEQINHGFHIAQNELKPGDLVFFKTSKATRHVGVYVGNNEFIHASKIKGVTISSLANNYWQAHYETARRITANA
ncbi:NlpC/P60 family protein [Scandinavium manionii]|uniref:NlpC/P60 family protein n=1 Tax=Scandinavium manionii TaxID=2926520 RepID=UPI0021667B26|nr:NlpC/P60 family protein [Scandinavium manionii]MCS2147132.1 NlpC/P60 family protein [Scandinavium manionii]MCS2164852.1 NlpC/P60 family protein [Scandinavium manionii]